MGGVRTYRKSETVLRGERERILRELEPVMRAAQLDGEIAALIVRVVNGDSALAVRGFNSHLVPIREV